MRKPKILFNCTTNIMGGAVQNAANFIAVALADETIDWVFAVSSEVDEILGSWNLDRSKSAAFASPGKSIRAGRSLRAYVDHADPDLVYTMAGPAYTTFRQLHMLGISNPYITNPSYMAFATNRSAWAAASLYLKTLLQMRFARRANHWIFQTGASRDGFCSRLGISPSRTTVIGNSIGQGFSETVDVGISDVANRTNRTLRILCPAADYPHKSLDMIPIVADLLRSRGGGDFKFQMTIPENGATWRNVSKLSAKYSVTEYVENLGPFSYTDAPVLFANSDLVFIPTILEVFSTSYLEAMSCGKPIVTTDAPFAREVCGDAADYFPARDSQAAADAISLATGRTDGIDRLREQQRLMLSKFGSYPERYSKLTATALDLMSANARSET